MNQGQPQASQTSAVKALLEPVALVLLSLATVGTAWCSYQAATWGGIAQKFTNQGATAARDAAAKELKATQIVLLDVLLFSQYVNARAASNEVLATFYSDRFRGEAKSAFDAWRAMKPFENPDAPPHPFVTNLYQPRLMTEVTQAQGESLRLSQDAGEAGRVSRSYILITVVLASALFCGGTASKFDRPWMRRVVVLLGLAAFVFAVERLCLLPMQL